MNSSESKVGASMTSRSPTHIPLAPYRINAADVDGMPSKLLQLVGEDKRVLIVGQVNEEIVQCLERQKCEVVVMTEATHTTDALLETFQNLPHGGENDGYDVVVFQHTFEHTLDPHGFLRIARRHIRATGCVIARVANVAHGNVRLALMAGRFPFGDGDSSPIRFYTYDSLIALFEKAGYAIGAVEREEEEFAEPSDLPPDIAADLHESVAAASESLTAHFVLAALPLPSPRFGWLLSRMRILTESVDSSRKDAAIAREDLAAVNAHVRLLIDQQHLSVRREKEFQTKLLAAHERMLTLDEEFRGACNTLAEWQSRERAWQEQERSWQERVQSWVAPSLDTSVEDGLRDTLTACIEDREHARHLTHLANLRVIELEARLNRIRNSLPGKAYRGTRKLARWFIPGMPYRAIRRVVRGR